MGRIGIGLPVALAEPLALRGRIGVALPLSVGMGTNRSVVPVPFEGIGVTVVGVADGPPSVGTLRPGVENVSFENVCGPCSVAPPVAGAALY